MNFRLSSMVVMVVMTLISLNLYAQETESQKEKDAELVKQAQNPIANLMSFPFQNNTNFNVGPDSNRTQNILNIQPVIPLFHGRLITRTIIPLIWNPDYTQDSGTDFGIGDIQFSAFYAPAAKGITWGIGPVISFPTGGDGFGTGKWSAGASLVALVMPGQWVVGALLNNVWSFAGEEDKPDVNFFTLQPFINYNLPESYYFTFSPIITANWEAPSGNQWTVPLGLGFGKLIKVGGKLPLNLNASYYYNVVTPDGGAASQLRIQAAVLLPTSIL